MSTLTNPITLGNIATFIGGTAPHRLSEYYSTLSGIPASGLISLSNFNNKYNLKQLTRIQASDPAADDQFGGALAISGDGNTLAVGAQLDDLAAGVDVGSVYIYVRSGTTWNEQVRLTGGSEADRFGCSVSLSSDGNILVVGINRYNVGIYTDAGAVSIYTRSGTSWSNTSNITNPSPYYGDLFGTTVIISPDGNTAALGAYIDDAGGTDAGTVYIYTRSGTSWSNQATLLASDAASGDLFGNSIALSSDGNTAAIGSVSDDNTGGVDTGSVYIFTRSGTTWSQQTRLQASDAASGDRFGSSIAISYNGNTLAVGVNVDDNTGGTDAGSVYVFTRSGTIWSQQTRLQASDAATSDRFGSSVTISSDGNIIIVGAYYDANSGGTDAGSIYLYTRSGTTWTEQNRLQASDAGAGDLFGNVRLSSNGTILAVGASSDDNTGGTNAGSVYIYTIPPPIFTSLQPTNISIDTTDISYNFTYNFLVNQSVNWTLTPTTFGDINSSGILTLIFPRKTIASGTFIVSASGIAGITTQSWTYNVIVPPPIILSSQPSNILINTTDTSYNITYNFQANQDVSWSVVPTTYGNINSNTGVLTILFLQNTTVSGNFTVSATATGGITTQSWSYNVTDLYQSGKIIRRYFLVSNITSSTSGLDLAFKNSNGTITYETNFTVPNTDNYGLEYTCWFIVPTTGSYSFGLTSDDGSDLALFINGLWQIISYAYGFKTSESIPPNPGTITLTANVLYPIRIRYHEGTNSQSLNVSFYAGTLVNVIWSSIPFSYFRVSLDVTPTLSTITANGFPIPNNMPIIISSQPVNILQSSSNDIFTISYGFLCDQIATWSLTPTTYGNIDSYSGFLTLSFPQYTSTSGTFSVTATGLYGTSTQSWTYNITNIPIITSIQPINIIADTSNNPYIISYNFSANISVVWSLTPTTYGNISSNGNLTLTFPQYTNVSGSFIVTATGTNGTTTQTWSYNIINIPLITSLQPVNIVADTSNTSYDTVYNFTSNQDVSWSIIPSYYGNINSNGVLTISIPLYTNASGNFTVTAIKGGSSSQLWSYNITGTLTDTISGGTYIDVNNYRIRTFVSSSSLIVSSTTTVDFLLIAGGGGGGTTYDRTAGGGGAGGVIYQTGVAISPNTYSITLGGGGGPSSNGNDSIFSAYTAKGGGKGGGTTSDTTLIIGGNGGSGGGVCHKGGGSPGTGTSGQGFSGGGEAWDSSDGLFGTFAGSGGGGAGGNGGNGVGSVGGGSGGIGKLVSITGTAIYYAGGGGGGTQSLNNQNLPAGAGGAGGGGAGGAALQLNSVVYGLNATFYGGGAGGGGGHITFTNAFGVVTKYQSDGGSGYQGVFIIKYSYPASLPIITSPQPNNIIANTTSNQYDISYNFTANKTVIWSLTPTTYGNINSSSGALTLIFPISTTASGTIIISATGTGGTVTQSWTFNIT